MGCGGDLVQALNAKVYGNGTSTLVLSHGFGGDQTVWHFLIPYLAACFKVVVFDLVFSGNVSPTLYDPNRYSDFRSYAGDLLCLLDQLNIKKTVYMGHSMSAMIGCIAATQRPELFEHLILLGGSPRYLDAEGYKGGLSESALEAILYQIGHNFTQWVPTFAPQAVGVNDTTAINEFERSLGRMKPEIAFRVAKVLFRSDLRGFLPMVHVPCTIIQSEKDFIVPELVACYMKENLGSQALVEILEVEGHLPQLTAYPLLVQVLKQVLLHISQ